MTNKRFHNGARTVFVVSFITVSLI
jgi:hypothetical protein